MNDEVYSGDVIAFLGALWGEGYMSPGGPEEVARVLDGLDLAGKTVLDIGCGAGGISVDLVRNHGAGRVIGIDVEPQICAAARRHVEATGLTGRVEIRDVSPGPIPVEDASIDLVFSKDSIIHIPDKEWLSREAFRILKPGGWFAASDWLISHDGPPSPAMADYIAAEGLGFAMASPGRYRAALIAAGFADVTLVNRNAWYREQARAELGRLTGPERRAFEDRFGAEAIAAEINTWTLMLPLVESGEHCPHHLRGRKP
ncbi:methyltransferase domain-containing protein [Rhodobacteraceae bacterium NNCM2]|nr:methyltransferase domain-containing protein [Coraliihabitans acroporae]